MKRRILFILCIAFSVHTFAELPNWVKQPPRSGNSTYLYKVTHGVGSSEREARNDAWTQMFQIAISMVNNVLDPQDIANAVQSGENYHTISNKYNIPINLACPEELYYDGKKYHVWLLCQVPNSSILKPQFDECTICNQRDKVNYVGYSFVPGMAQIKKGSVAKGACFITGEVVFIGGIVVGECMRSSYVNKINSTHNADLRKQYTQNANTWALVRNISIAGAAAIYVWNVIDGIVAKAPIQVGNTAMNFAPYADFESAGLAVNVQF